ncbi:hypothetical protein ACFL3S_10865, partial [Gemmatimonadota bacterium]
MSPHRPSLSLWAVGVLPLVAFLATTRNLPAQEFRVELPTPFVSGYARPLRGEVLTYHSPMPSVDQSLLVRSEDRQRSIVWESAPLPSPLEDSVVTLVVMAGIDVHELPRRFDVQLNGEEVLTIGNPLTAEAGETLRWEGSQGVVAELRVVLIDKYGDAMGFLYFHVPSTLLEPGRPVRFEVLGESADARTWFMVFQKHMVQEIEIRNAPALLKTDAGEVQVLRMDVLDLVGGTPFQMESPIGTVDSTLALGLTRISLPVAA